MQIYHLQVCDPNLRERKGSNTRLFSRIEEMAIARGTKLAKIKYTKGTYHDQCDQQNIAQCLSKLPKNDFTRKMNDFDTFTKIA